MFKALFPFVVLLIFTGKTCVGQATLDAEKVAVVNNFIVNYNNNDYGKMRKDMFAAAKVVLGKKRMQEVFGKIHNDYGNFTILSLSQPAENKTEVILSPGNDPSEPEKFTFIFNKKNKLTGFYFKSPDFKYSKSDYPFPAREAKNKVIDSILNMPIFKEKFNGCILTVDGGEVLYKDCFGYADFEKKQFLNEHSVFELASCSKHFTAMGIMILAEKGMLDLTDDVQKFFPDLPYNNITIEHLLTHTSGLPDYMVLLEKYWDKKKIAANKDIIEAFIKYKPKKLFNPGAEFRYSNTGYALLSSVIEKVSGQTFPDFLRDNIFQPLGMNNTRVYTRRSMNFNIDNYAFGHVYSEKHKRYMLPDSLSSYNYVYFLDAITGDGTVNSTISDLFIWDRALRENKLISAASMEKCYRGYTLRNGKSTGYGYGLMTVEEEEFERLTWHSGGWPGYHTLVLRFIDKEKAVIILSNNEYSAVSRLADKLSKILLACPEQITH
jgi:CubicO group peptidase (beta-lactamase class C family)